jgi:hypothetical protein
MNTEIGTENERIREAKAVSFCEDQRLRRNIQWGIVRGIFLYNLILVPITLVAWLIIDGLRH